MCIFEYSGRCQTIFKSVLSIDSMVMMMMIIPLILINIWYVQSVSQLFITAANSWDKQLINRKFYFGSQFWWFQSMTIAMGPVARKHVMVAVVARSLTSWPEKARGKNWVPQFPLCMSSHLPEDLLLGPTS
jgi:hypothetical protein